MKNQQFQELVLQSLEHERGGERIYTTALQCVRNPDLKKEWEKYFAETQTHVTALQSVCEAMGIDATTETPGRALVRQTGETLVQVMKRAMSQGDATGAELVACECVVLAETKDHMDWELLTKCIPHLKGEAADVLRSACEKIEQEEDKHLYHTKGWCRELWIQSLGLQAVVPPPEERMHVKTAIGAARAEQTAPHRR